MYSAIINRQKNATIRHEYYGDFEFIDDQDKCDAVFGKRPTIYSFHPLSNTRTDAKHLLLLHAEKYMLDVFLSVAEQDYVGTDILSQSLSTFALCEEIGQLNQEY